LLEAVTAVQSAVGELLDYESGATEVGVSVAEIFEHRRGVCQDYAHVALAAYRSLGLPARYVSGYLYARDSSSGELPTDDAELVVATHAWVEVAISGHGWWGLDPTNQLLAGSATSRSATVGTTKTSHRCVACTTATPNPAAPRSSSR
jgi:transglutaminase-like putative cysteine protease